MKKTTKTVSAVLGGIVMVIGATYIKLYPGNTIVTLSSIIAIICASASLGMLSGIKPVDEIAKNNDNADTSKKSDRVSEFKTITKKESSKKKITG